MGLLGNLAWAALWALDRPAQAPGSGTYPIPEGMARAFLSPWVSF